MFTLTISPSSFNFLNILNSKNCHCNKDNPYKKLTLEQAENKLINFSLPEVGDGLQGEELKTLQQNLANDIKSNLTTTGIHIINIDPKNAKKIKYLERHIRNLAMAQNPTEEDLGFYGKSAVCESPSKESNFIRCINKTGVFIDDTKSKLAGDIENILNQVIADENKTIKKVSVTCGESYSKSKNIHVDPTAFTAFMTIKGECTKYAPRNLVNGDYTIKNAKKNMLSASKYQLLIFSGTGIKNLSIQDSVNEAGFLAKKINLFHASPNIKHNKHKPRIIFDMIFYEK